MTQPAKISHHPNMKNHPKIKGGWHIKTKDGSTFSNLTMEQAVLIHHQEQETKDNIIPFIQK